MAASMKSFAKALVEDAKLRARYRGDPIDALRSFGVTELSLDDINALTTLPNQNLADAQALTVLLEYFAENM